MAENEKYLIYIDANTGTYGGADNLLLVSVDTDDLDYLEDASDSTINQFGADHGEPVLSVYQAASWINQYLSPEAREKFLAHFDPEV